MANLHILSRVHSAWPPKADRRPALTPDNWAAAGRSKPVHGLSRGWASAIRATTRLPRPQPPSLTDPHYPAEALVVSIVAGASRNARLHLTRILVDVK